MFLLVQVPRMVVAPGGCYDVHKICVLHYFVMTLSLIHIIVKIEVCSDIVCSHTSWSKTGLNLGLGGLEGVLSLETS